MNGIHMDISVTDHIGIAGDLYRSFSKSRGRLLCHESRNAGDVKLYLFLLGWFQHVNRIIACTISFVVFLREREWTGSPVVIYVLCPKVKCDVI